MNPRASSIAVLFAIACGACSSTPAPAPTSSLSVPNAPTSTTSVDPWKLRGVERLVTDAKRLAPLVQSEGARAFLSHVSALPRVAPRKLFFKADKSHWYTEAEVASLPANERDTLQSQTVDEQEYYNTHYGSPLSYTRPLDILFSRGMTLPPGSKVLDFGYGYIGHLRLLATMGIHTTGVDVSPFLRAIYSFSGDQGPVRDANGQAGSIRLIDGRFPADPAVVLDVDGGYSLVISKNVLKRGYIHPERPVSNPKARIDLGASDEHVLAGFHDVIVPGGFFLIYNICPAPTPPDKPFVPWSDGRAPFSRLQFEAAGFEVLEYDKDDTEAVRVMGQALGWDQPEDGEPGMDLENDLSVLYTLVVRKP